MNTLTDAQVVVSGDVVALLDRLDAAGPARRAWCTTNARRSTPWRSNGFLVADRAPSARRWSRTSPPFREDASQLRVTILTTLQCNFACDYCYQGEHGDFGRPAEQMSIETAARVAAGSRRGSTRSQPARLVLTFFGGEPLLNMPAMIDIAGRSCERAPGVARRHADRQHHHQRPAAHARARRPPAAARPDGRQGHARRRPRDARPDAAAAGRPGHLRPHHRERPPRRRRARHHRRQLRHGDGRPVPGAARFPEGAGRSRPRSSKVAFKPVIKPAGPAPGARTVDAKCSSRSRPVDQDRAPLNGSCMTAAGPRRRSSLRLAATSSTTR